MEDEDEADDFFTEKGKKVVDDVDEASDEDEEESKTLPELSKRALRKIRAEGPYAGKNKVKFDAGGKALKKTEGGDYMD